MENGICGRYLHRTIISSEEIDKRISMPNDYKGFLIYIAEAPIYCEFFRLASKYAPSCLYIVLLIT